VKARIQWMPVVRDAVAELPARDQELVFEKIRLLQFFPRIYAVIERGRFRRHRRFVAGNWCIYYRVVENTVYVRGIWPARIP